MKYLKEKYGYLNLVKYKIMEEKTIKLHKLKLVQPFFSEVQKGTKTFELRRNDRDFQIEDEICLQEYDMVHHVFSGDEIKGEITYVLKNRVGLDEDFCIFSFKKI